MSRRGDVGRRPREVKRSWPMRRQAGQFRRAGFPRRRLRPRNVRVRQGHGHRDARLRTATSTPSTTIDKLCDEYQINVALHNHPKPSKYWDPDTVLEVCKGRSKRIGSCADTGHWMRSGSTPSKLHQEARRPHHLLPLQGPEPVWRGGHDVPWGTGKATFKAMLTRDPPPEASRPCSRSSTSTTGPTRCRRSPSACRTSTSGRRTGRRRRSWTTPLWAACASQPPAASSGKAR